MSKFLRTTVLAAAATAAVFSFASPLLAATPVLQPHTIVLGQADEASPDKVIAVRGGRGGFHGGRGFRGGGMMWRRGGGGWCGGGWRGGDWHGYRWGCVPVYRWGY